MYFNIITKMLKNEQYFRNYKKFIFKPTVYEYEIYRWSINYLSHKINILPLNILNY